MNYLRTFLVGLCLLVLNSFVAMAQETQLAKISVEAGDHNRSNTPVTLALDGINYEAEKDFLLQEIKGSEKISVPVQLEKGHKDRIWWVLSGSMQAGEKREYILSQQEKQAVSEPLVNIVRNDTALQVLLADQKTLQYNNAIMAPPEGASKLYERSAFIHPLWSPDGAELTRIHAPDHIHHMGIWNPWTKTKFEGREIDFWNLNKGEGTVRFANYLSVISGDIYGGFKAAQEHVDLKAPGGEKVAMNEEWDVRVWNNSGYPNGAYLWDFTSILNCAGSSPITLEEYRYAGFGFRATEEWHKDNSGIKTSEGKTRTEADATNARWCKVYGETEKGMAGILFMSHPSNYNHPEPMRIWPVDANEGRGDVFFQFAPTRDRDWKLEPGNDYALKYRMYVYEGALSDEEAERIWQDFANPPAVTIVKR